MNKIKNGNKGFTLLEILMVVLIIGILAAIALPQYKLAVTKAEIGTLLPLVKTIKTAEENYYLYNGTYTLEADMLDIEMPKLCLPTDISRAWACSNNMQFLFDNTFVMLRFCPGKTHIFSDCKNSTNFEIISYYSKASVNSNKQHVLVYNNSQLGEQIKNWLHGN